MHFTANNCSKRKFSRVLKDDCEDLEEISEELRFLASPALVSDKYKLNSACQKYMEQFLLKPKSIFNIARKLMKQIEDLPNEVSLSNLEEKMQTILNILEAYRFHTRLRKGQKLDHCDYLIFKNSILQFSEIPENIQMKLIASTNSKQECAASNYYHLYVDVLWFFCTIAWDSDNLQKTLHEVLSQMVFMALKQYERTRSIVFCKCLKETWLKIQLFCEMRDLEFWEILSDVFKSYDEEFSIHLINYQAYLQCFNEKGEFVEFSSERVKGNLELFNQKWSLFLQNCKSLNSVEEGKKICDTLIKIEPLITELWLDDAKLDFLYLTWDYFYKMLETIETEENFEHILKSIDSKSDSGYLIFLRILKKHLKRHPNHWNRFKGRIYTRFPPAKFAKLSEQGIRNLILIFFSGSSEHFEEIVMKVVELLDGLPLNQQCNCTVWNIYTTLFQECLKRDKKIDKMSEKFLSLVQNTSTNRSKFYLISQFVGHLQGFFSVPDLTLKQNVFLGQWMENYMKTCEHSNLMTFLNVLVFIMRRIIEKGVWFEYQHNFVSILLPTLKHQVQNHEIVGTIAALIVANTNYQGFSQLSWIETFTTDVGPSTVAFLTTVIKSSAVININAREISSLFVRVWFQCWVVGIQNAEFTKLTFELLDLNFSQNDAFETFLMNTNKEEIENCCFKLESHLIKHPTLQTYANMALVFNYCGPLLYKQSSKCRLSKFIDILLLPLDVLRGNKPSFLNNIEKTWHLFVIALMKVCDGDPYLERVLKDLIIRYLPLFSQPHPLVKILNDPKLSRFAYLKINNEYFQYGTSRLNNDEHLSKVLNCFLTLINDFEVDQLEIFCECLLTGLFEVYIFKNHKVVVINIFKSLATKKMLKDYFETSLGEVTKRHLALNASNYFQLMYVLAKIVPLTIREFLLVLKDEINVVERKRGQGFDSHLRSCFDKLKKLHQ